MFNIFSYLFALNSPRLLLITTITRCLYFESVLTGWSPELTGGRSFWWHFADYGTTNVHYKIVSADIPFVCLLFGSLLPICCGCSQCCDYYWPDLMCNCDSPEKWLWFSAVALAQNVITWGINEKRMQNAISRENCTYNSILLDAGMYNMMNCWRRNRKMIEHQLGMKKRRIKLHCKVSTPKAVP